MVRGLLFELAKVLLSRSAAKRTEDLGRGPWQTHRA